MIKVGSKRRRTQAQIQDAYSQQLCDDINARDNVVKLSESELKVIELEKQLAQVMDENEKGIYAGGWIQEQLDQKNLGLTSDNKLIITTGANTITNGDDLMDGSNL